MSKPFNIFKSYDNLNKKSNDNDKKEFKVQNNDFPELTIIKKQIINDTSSEKSFINTLKKEIKITHVETNEEEKTPDGWVSFKYEKSNSPLFGQNLKVINKVIIINNENVENKNEAFETINNLCSLYEKRRNEYIKLWGEDEYNEMFISPNYDDTYFDKLDEKYEIEQQKLNEQYSNNDDDNYYYDNTYIYDYKS